MSTRLYAIKIRNKGDEIVFAISKDQKVLQKMIETKTDIETRNEYFVEQVGLHVKVNDVDPSRFSFCVWTDLIEEWQLDDKLFCCSEGTKNIIMRIGHTLREYSTEYQKYLKKMYEAPYFIQNPLSHRVFLDTFYPEGMMNAEYYDLSQSKPFEKNCDDKLPCIPPSIIRITT